MLVDLPKLQRLRVCFVSSLTLYFDSVSIYGMKEWSSLNFWKMEKLELKIIVLENVSVSTAIPHCSHHCNLYWSLLMFKQYTTLAVLPHI
jgi:hypothetical protein